MSNSITQKLKYRQSVVKFSFKYGVTKAAVHALAKNLVKVFEGTGTTVNAVVPGFVETPWQKEKPEEIKQIYTTRQLFTGLLR